MSNLTITITIMAVVILIAIGVICFYNRSCKRCYKDNENLVLAACNEFQRLIASQRDSSGFISAMSVDLLIIEMETRYPTLDFSAPTVSLFGYTVVIVKGNIKETFTGPYHKV